MSESLLLLDACCAINLLASGAADEILQALPHEVAVARLVFEREVLYVRAEDGEVPVEDEGARPEEVGVELSLRPLADEGLLHVLEPETHEEHATWVDLALQLDDGEAMTGALAIHRNALLATDDRKAIRVLGQRLPESRILRTSELLKVWADGVGSHRARAGCTRGYRVSGELQTAEGRSSCGMVGGDSRYSLKLSLVPGPTE